MGLKRLDKLFLNQVIAYCRNVSSEKCEKLLLRKERELLRAIGILYRLLMLVKLGADKVVEEALREKRRLEKK